jgi:hypothetical protein
VAAPTVSLTDTPTAVTAVNAVLMIKEYKVKLLPLQAAEICTVERYYGFRIV